jgi:hypothetical protein
LRQCNNKKKTAVINSANGKWIKTTCWACLADSTVLRSKGLGRIHVSNVIDKISNIPNPRPSGMFHVATLGTMASSDHVETRGREFSHGQSGEFGPCRLVISKRVNAGLNGSCNNSDRESPSQFWGPTTRPKQVCRLFPVARAAVRERRLPISQHP